MGARNSNSVLPDLLSQASPATPPRHDRSTSEEVCTHKIHIFFFFLHMIYQYEIKF